jgi:stage V sporulation protein AD
LLSRVFTLTLRKAKMAPADVRYVFAGDLLNQCISSAYAFRDTEIPYFGLYGACSTMAESLSLAAMTVSAGFAPVAAAATSSHFCSAERQFRLPLEYGGQRTPTAQWTVTGSGAIILTAEGTGPYITHITPGRIVDCGITDLSNMGAAMAPAAYDTLSAHFSDLKISPTDYDLIVTGDLGTVGSSILVDFFKSDGITLGERYNDCGVMIFDPKTQDTHAGGSGCGCSAAVLCGELLNGMREGKWKKLLFAATGALMSPTSSLQGESIPSVCSAISISTSK